MIDKIEQLIKQYDKLMIEISKPEIMSDIKKYTELAKEEKTLYVILPKDKLYRIKWDKVFRDQAIKNITVILLSRKIYAQLYLKVVLIKVSGAHTRAKQVGDVDCINTKY